MYVIHEWLFSYKSRWYCIYCIETLLFISQKMTDTFSGQYTNSNILIGCTTLLQWTLMGVLWQSVDVLLWDILLCLIFLLRIDTAGRNGHTIWVFKDKFPGMKLQVLRTFTLFLKVFDSCCWIVLLMVLPIYTLSSNLLVSFPYILAEMGMIIKQKWSCFDVFLWILEMLGMGHFLMLVWPFILYELLTCIMYPFLIMMVIFYLWICSWI